MKNLSLLLAATVGAFLPQKALAQDGALDPAFAADIRISEFQTTSVSSAVPLLDGKILVSGNFETVDGTAQRHAARLHPNGSRDASFAPVFVGGFFGVTYVQPDGKILIGGDFSSVNGGGGRGLARLLPDGTTDPSFSFAGLNDVGAIYGILPQPDGRILIYGNFTTVGGIARPSLARLEANGSLDTSFAPSLLIAANPNTKPRVFAGTLQPDGDILLGGNFTEVNGQPRSRFVRLNSDGSLDPFTLDVSNNVSCILFQPDGKLLVGGSFSTVRGEARPRLVRLLSDGTFDNSFTPPTLALVLGISLQADGRLLLVDSNVVRRLNADGTLDSSWAASSLGTINSIAQQADGKVLIGRAGQTPQPDTPWWPVLRFLNGSTTQNLAIEAGRVRYLRTGPAPELASTTFELSTDGGATWTTLGNGSRIAGDSRNWELNGLALPSSGMVRVLARAAGSGFPTSVGMLAFQRIFNLAAPEMFVEEPAGTAVANGAIRDFGTLPIGGTRTLTFTVRNLGDAALTGVGVSISGPDADLFGIVTPPASSVPGPDGSTTFSIRFAPVTPGTKTATLHLASNSAGNNPFSISLTGHCSADGGAAFFYDEANASTFGLASQPDGAIVVVGQFTNIGSRPRSRMVRYRADGSVDPTFQPAANEAVFQCGILPDGKIIVAGRFTSITGVARSKVARLHADGSVDAAFVPPTISDDVWSVALQLDGKLLVGGTFTQVAGAPSSRLIRLNTDGSLDPSFTAPALDAMVSAITPLPDGRILVGTYGSASVVRLHANGALDSTFQTTNASVITGIVVQSDGRIVIIGNFTSVNGQPRQRLARLEADGALDASFIQPIDSLPQGGLALQSDGRMLIGGFFNNPRRRLVRLRPDATVDTSLVADIIGPLVYGLGLGPRGEILLNGGFDSINGVTPTAGGQASTVRLHNTAGSSAVSVTSPSRVQWLRSGSVSELTWARFDLSTDGGSTWSTLGSGTRIAGGWELTGFALPTSGLIRAVGNTASGHQSGGFSTVLETTSFAYNQLQTWRALHGLADNGTQDLANPSSDGIANLLKFAFNMAPNAGDLNLPNVTVLPSNGTAGLPRIERDAQGRLVIEFVRRKAASNPGISYTVETGDNLTGLTALDLSSATVVPIDALWERVTVTDPTITGQRFGRVRVSPAP